MEDSHTADIAFFKGALATIPRRWDGKSCILELREAEYNWRQMEWPGFYFEYKVQQILRSAPPYVTIPGEKYDRVAFDLMTKINWDIKSRAANSRDQTVILNDRAAMESSVNANGLHGEIIGICDYHYNDESRSFQEWHTKLKGGLSNYEKKRRGRTPTSRLRKTSATLKEIVYIVLDADSLSHLKSFNQGRNSNGQPRPPKFSLNLNDLHHFHHERQVFDEKYLL